MIVVLAEDDPVADQDRGAGGAEIVLKRTKRPMPHLLAGAVVAEQACGSKKADDALVISNRCGLSMAADLVDFFERLGGRLHLPENPARLALQSQGNQPFLADAGKVHPVTDNNGRRMTRRQRSFPEHIGGGPDVGRQRGILGRQAGTIRPTELGPVRSGGHGAKNGETCQGDDF